AGRPPGGKGRCRRRPPLRPRRPKLRDRGPAAHVQPGEERQVRPPRAEAAGSGRGPRPLLVHLHLVRGGGVIRTPSVPEKVTPMQSTLSAEEIVRRGEALYNQQIKPLVEPTNVGK